MDQLENGNDADTTLKTVTIDLPNLEYRQLTVVDINGNTACHTGSKILGVNAESQGHHCCAAGNLLNNESVPGAMTKKFKALNGIHLAERLMLSLKAGLDAGGEAGDVHSSALMVSHNQTFPLVDLRVDWSNECPVSQLYLLWKDYEPQMMDYLTRAINPAKAPSYGVAGDL